MEYQLTAEQESLKNEIVNLINAIHIAIEIDYSKIHPNLSSINKNIRFLLEILTDYIFVISNLEPIQSSALITSISNLKLSIINYIEFNNGQRTEIEVLNSFNLNFVKFTNDYSPILFYYKVFPQISEVKKLENIEADISRTIKESNIELDKIRIELDKVKSLKEEYHKEITESSVTAFTTPLQNEIDSLTKSLKIWYSIYGTTIVVIIIAIYIIYKYYKDHSEIITINYNFISIKITLFIVLFALINFSSKNIKAIKHNITVLKQKLISLKTFEGFTASANDPNIKDLMLTKLAETAFGIHNSGYIDGEKESKYDLSYSEIAKIFDKTK